MGLCIAYYRYGVPWLKPLKNFFMFVDTLYSLVTVLLEYLLNSYNLFLFFWWEEPQLYFIVEIIQIELKMSFGGLKYWSVLTEFHGGYNAANYCLARCTKLPTSSPHVSNSVMPVMCYHCVL